MTYSIQITDRLGRQFLLADYFQTDAMEITQSTYEHYHEFMTFPIHGQSDLHIRGRDVLSIQMIKD